MFQYAIKIQLFIRTSQYIYIHFSFIFFVQYYIMNGIFCTISQKYKIVLWLPEEYFGKFIIIIIFTLRDHMIYQKFFSVPNYN